ncbi:toll/interleukin-1 receptor domain-containing protein [Methanolobus mangrovi]|uniref:Toll/interleukin-1 receptor domain-containing protein n=1 Tax=Methanolobus mangrovi TaxID=3072977 RepID=A0AA51YH38_9EURY|nr:toll/interleukin-1 receptor domain-containing protein [Methanolobus mangrovi]WMW22771.1 toll/interleukin-1 receptor domain-containing protein [Methanolobus mangrovi]
MDNHKVDHKLPKEIDKYLAALANLYENSGTQNLWEIVVNAKVSVHEEWSHRFDFNEDIYGHAVYLYLPATLYVNSFNQKEELQNKLIKDLNSVHHVKNEFIDDVFLEMDVPEELDWRKDASVQLNGNVFVSSADEKRIWGDGGFKLFLSHKTEVKTETAELKNRLKMYGVTCFVAHEDIRPTREWQNEIEIALHSMDAFVALLTDNFHESDWTDQEIGFAFGRGVPIVSMRLGRDPYGFIGKFQALSCSWESAPGEIVSILIKYDKMVDVYIDIVKNCKSFDEGNMLSKMLPHIDALSEQQISNLISAFNENDQVHYSLGFNGKKPYAHGYGLVHHLNRLAGNQYEYTEDNKIMLKK